jgi:hypothetical protein
MSRRLWLRAAVLFSGYLAFPLLARPGLADPQVANLNETLRSVLRCRREEEFDFVDAVTQRVDQGVLPLDMVLSTMKWAYERRRDLPFPYFKEGITKRAAAIGVDL